MEEQEEKRPRAALINREWLEAAETITTREQLSEVVLCAVEYVIYGKCRKELDGDMQVILAMIKPWLDSDITAYRERCERNRRNAQRGGEKPVAASGTQSQRVGATTTPTTTPTTTTTPISLEKRDEKEIEREKWLIYGYFWSTGSKAIKEETNAFWDYYESLGWKNNKGAPIVSKIAAARMWRRQFEGGEPPKGSDAWYKVAQACRVADFRLWAGYLGAERVEDHVLVRFRLTPAYIDKLQTIMPDLTRDLARLWGTERVDLKGLLT